MYLGDRSPVGCFTPNQVETGRYGARPIQPKISWLRFENLDGPRRVRNGLRSAVVCSIPSVTEQDSDLVNKLKSLTCLSVLFIQE